MQWNTNLYTFDTALDTNIVYIYNLLLKLKKILKY